MLSLSTQGYFKNCDGISRREMLKIGTLGFGGLTLSSLLEARATAAEAGAVLKDRSVVLLFLEGGAQSATLVVQYLDLNRVNLVGQVLHLVEQSIVATLRNVAGLVDRERLGDQDVLLNPGAE